MVLVVDAFMVFAGADTLGVAVDSLMAAESMAPVVDAPTAHAGADLKASAVHAPISHDAGADSMALAVDAH